MKLKPIFERVCGVLLELKKEYRVPVCPLKPERK